MELVPWLLGERQPKYDEIFGDFDDPHNDLTFITKDDVYFKVSSAKLARTCDFFETALAITIPSIPEPIYVDVNRRVFRNFVYLHQHLNAARCRINSPSEGVDLYKLCQQWGSLKTHIAVELLQRQHVKDPWSLLVQACDMDDGIEIAKIAIAKFGSQDIVPAFPRGRDQYITDEPHEVLREALHRLSIPAWRLALLWAKWGPFWKGAVGSPSPPEPVDNWSNVASRFVTGVVDDAIPLGFEQCQAWYLADIPPVPIHVRLGAAYLGLACLGTASLSIGMDCLRAAFFAAQIGVAIIHEAIMRAAYVGGLSGAAAIEIAVIAAGYARRLILAIVNRNSARPRVGGFKKFRRRLFRRRPKKSPAVKSTLEHTKRPLTVDPGALMVLLAIIIETSLVLLLCQEAYTRIRAVTMWTIGQGFASWVTFLRILSAMQYWVVSVGGDVNELPREVWGVIDMVYRDAERELRCSSHPPGMQRSRLATRLISSIGRRQDHPVTLENCGTKGGSALLRERRGFRWAVRGKETLEEYTYPFT